MQNAVDSASLYEVIFIAQDVILMEIRVKLQFQSSKVQIHQFSIKVICTMTETRSSVVVIFLYIIFLADQVLDPRLSNQ